MVNNKDSACQVNPVLSRKADREVGQVGRVIPNAPQLEDFYREGTRRSANEKWLPVFSVCSWENILQETKGTESGICLTRRTRRSRRVEGLSRKADWAQKGLGGSD
jgi:hypothetical protein